MKNHEFDMLIIDEFFVAYEKNLIDRELAEKIVFRKEKTVNLF